MFSLRPWQGPIRAMFIPFAPAKVVSGEACLSRVPMHDLGLNPRSQREEQSALMPNIVNNTVTQVSMYYKSWFFRTIFLVKTKFSQIFYIISCLVILAIV